MKKNSKLQERRIHMKEQQEKAEQEKKEFKEACTPLLKYLGKGFGKTAIVTATSIELVESSIIEAEIHEHLVD